MCVRACSCVHAHASVTHTPCSGSFYRNSSQQCNLWRGCRTVFYSSHYLCKACSHIQWWQCLCKWTVLIKNKKVSHLKIRHGLRHWGHGHDASQHSVLLFFLALYTINYLAWMRTSSKHVSSMYCFCYSVFEVVLILLSAGLMQEKSNLFGLCKLHPCF